MRYLLIAVSVLWSIQANAGHTGASVSVGVNLPGINIGINEREFPELILVPGYPVYYSPRGGSNYFFYDGEYWVFQRDRWYASDWYNGPWEAIEPEYVPEFVLRVPVRYYNARPAYFHGWRRDEAPRWGARWGQDWERRRNGWDHWDRRAHWDAAPLPSYQRGYSGDRYPRAPEQRQSIRIEQYHYQPHEAIIQRHYRQERSAKFRRVDTERDSHPAPDRQTDTLNNEALSRRGDDSQHDGQDRRQGERHGSHQNGEHDRKGHGDD